MTFQVIVTQRAKDDLRHYYLHAAKHAPATAARWLGRFERVLESLAENPGRCPLAPENDLVEQPIRQLIHGKRAARYRVLFTIDSEQVLILHIRRGTMDKAVEIDLFE